MLTFIGQYLDRPAQVCVTDEVVELSFDEDPVCQTHSTETDGSLVGTSGTVAIEVDQGFNTDTSYTVSRTFPYTPSWVSSLYQCRGVYPWHRL